MSVTKWYNNFRSTVNVRTFLIYLAITLIIPAISIAIEYLISKNPKLRQSLQIDLQDFHVYQLFTSQFVHANFDHFLANVTVYLLIAIYGLVLATLINRKRLYVVLSKIIVVLFLLFGACFALFNATTTYYVGLSGIDSALAGLLLLFWLVYLEQISKQRMRSYYGLVLCCIIALSAGILVRYNILYHAERSITFLAPLAAMLIVFAFTLGFYWQQFVELKKVLKSISLANQLITISIVAIFAYFIWNIFPEQLGNGTRNISISLHVAGVLIGVLAGYIFLIYLERINYFNGETPVICGK